MGRNIAPDFLLKFNTTCGSTGKRKHYFITLAEAIEMLRPDFKPRYDP